MISLTMLAALAASAVLVPAVASAQSVNVRDVGAVGDGKADDTAAFQSAVTRAAAQGLSVFVPRGTYRTTKPIVLKGLAMAGPDGGAWNADTDTLPVLAPAHRDGPCVTLDAGGALKGICIRYDWAKEPETGPAAVLVTGVGAFVSCVKVMYPWDGIIADGVNNVGRLNVENVFMVAPRNVGVRVTGTWDVPALRNVEVWNAGPVPRGLEKGIGFDLGKNDLIRMTDCFAFAMGTGFLLRDEIPGCKIKGGTWGTMANCATDFCSIGIDVKGDHTLSISGGTFWDHHVGLRVDGEGARVRMTGAELRSNGAPAIEVNGGDHVVISGCSVLRPMKEHPQPAVVLTGGSTTLSGSHIQSTADGVVIGAGVKSVEMTGNTIAAGSGKKVLDKRPAQPSP